MVGKIKRARQKFHQAAIRVGAATEEEPPVPINEPPDSADLPGAKGWEAQGPGKDWTFFSSNIFSSTKINPESLTQKLEVDTKSVISDKKEEKILVPKKEKAKQRRERWLQSFQPWNIFAEVFNIINLSLNNPWKIETLALAQQAKKAQAKRKATPVVGDMRPLVDALPELSELTAVRKPRAPRKQPKCSVKKKPEPTDYSKMRPAQKRKIIEEEMSRVQELIRNPSYKSNPLAAVGQHLLKRMKEEQETDPR